MAGVYAALHLGGHAPRLTETSRCAGRLRAIVIHMIYMTDAITEIVVRPAQARDAATWLPMRCSLRPGAEAEHVATVAAFFVGRAAEPQAVLLAESPQRGLVGFVELSVRSSAEGCRGPRVAYVEGLFVAPHVRRRGIGRTLIAAAERWALTQGCLELASHSAPDSRDGAETHRALGFEDVGLVRCFRKSL